MPKTVHHSPISTGQPLQQLLPREHFHDDSTVDSSSDLVHISQEGSRQPSPFADLPHPDRSDEDSRHQDERAKQKAEEDEEDIDAWAEDFSPVDDPAMPSDLRPPFLRPSEGKSEQPLLGKRRNPYARPEPPTRRSTFHERDSPRDLDLEARTATRRRYTYAAGFLLLSLVSFVIQTETAVYIQHTLKWNKAYCMLYVTHGSWSILWPCQLLILRLQKWNTPWPTFWRRHIELVRSTAQMVQRRTLHVPAHLKQMSPVPYFLYTTAYVTCALTLAGGSWYVAVDLTTASDLTAIYNCSAFFAYAFAIPLLHDKLKWSKVLSVFVAIAGVLIVAYGDIPAKHGSKSGGGAGGPTAPEKDKASNRALGNIIIGIGSVLYGFYEVLYKKVACPPERCSPGRGMIFANTFGSMIGCFTLAVLWIPLPILHFTGVERFELPRGEQAWLLIISIVANVTFSGSFLVLISLTSPVLSSVAALLTIFIVAIVDQVLPEPMHNALTPGAIAGGVLIIGAFLLLSWATYREMDEERRKMGDADDEESDAEES